MKEHWPGVGQITIGQIVEVPVAVDVALAETRRIRIMTTGDWKYLSNRCMERRDHDV
jgi:hypothetical protein